MARISGTQGYWEVYLNVTEVSRDIERNVSAAYWELGIRRTDGGTYPMYGTPHIVIYISGMLAHESNDYRAIGSINGNGVLIAAGTLSDIPHNPDGTISNNGIGFSWTGSGFSPNNVSASGTYDTATIPRASDIAVGNYNLGQNIGITIGKKNNSFTSTLSYRIGSRTGTIVSKTGQASYAWSMPIDLINQIKLDNPSNKKPTAKIYCETYSGDTKIGDTKEANFILTITDKPEITDVLREELNTNISEYTTKILRTISNNKFTINSTAPYGTTIQKYRIRNGTIDTGYKINNVIEVSNIQEFNSTDMTTTFTMTCVDARGNESNEFLVTYDFINYIYPSLNKTDISIKRTNDVTNDAKISISGNFYNDNIGEIHDEIKIVYKYKKTTESSYSRLFEVVPETNENTFSINNLLIEGEFNYSENYEFVFYAMDTLNSSDSFNYIFKSSIAIAKWHKDGLWVKKIEANNLYPIGSIYISVNDINPNEYFGGTWVRFGTGRTLVGIDTSQSEFNTIEKTGGSKYLQRHGHGISWDGIHSHGQNVSANPRSGGSGVREDYKQDTTGLSSYPQGINTADAGWHSHTIYETGDGNSQNLQPYITVYMWKRVA